MSTYIGILSPMASAIRRLLGITASLCSLPVGAWHIHRLGRAGGRRQAFAAKQCVESLGLPAPVAGGSPLKRLAPGVFEIERRWFAPFPTEPAAGMTVVHLLATGEHLHSPLPGLEKQCMLQPALAAHRHLIVDTVASPDVLASPSSRSVQQWHALRPVLAEIGGNTVFVGLGCGALAAIDMAPRLAALDGRRVGVLGLSAPVAFEPVEPPALHHIRALGPLADRLLAAERGMPSPLLRAQDWWLRRACAKVAALLLTTLNSDSRPYLRWAAWDITQRRPAEALRRLCRELSMLEALRGEDGRARMARAASALADSDRMQWSLQWGIDDPWLAVTAALAGSEAAFHHAGVPEARVECGLISGWGHAIGRDSTGDYGELALRFVDLCDRVGPGVRGTRSSFIRLTSHGEREAQRPARNVSRRS